MVIDTSALLAVYFNERHALWVLSIIESYPAAPMMSTVNLSEMLILLRDRNPSGYRALSDRLVGEPIRFIPPTISQAQLAAEARSKFPLNLGDCFAYALAKEEGEPLITLDRDFKRTDIKVLLPVR